MVKEWPELTEAKWNEEHKSSNMHVFTSRNRRRMRKKQQCHVLTCSRKRCCSENTTTYKRVSIALERVVTLKWVLIVTCKRVVRYSVIRMTHYLSLASQRVAGSNLGAANFNVKSLLIYSHKLLACFRGWQCVTGIIKKWITSCTSEKWTWS